MTIDELQALPDKELNAMAAKLRGLKAFNFQGVKWLGVTDAQGKTHGKYKLRDWTPATSRDQSGALLQWAATQGCYFTVGFGDFNSDVRVRINLERNEREIFVDETIPGNTARSETVAFCAAMLAIQGERQ